MNHLKQLFLLICCCDLFQSRVLATQGERHIVPIQQNVAFVFAGSARSFISPFVRTSIKRNLIDAFCAKEKLCDYDIFVRVSSNDNKHEGMEAKGIPLQGTPESKSKISAALTIFEPSLKWGSTNKMIVEFFELGGQQEKQSMIDYAKQHPQTELKHKTYRELDARRYSMYFNRWKAYEMVLNYEKTSPRNYVSDRKSEFLINWTYILLITCPDTCFALDMDCIRSFGYELGSTN